MSDRAILAAVLREPSRQSGQVELRNQKRGITPLSGKLFGSGTF